MNLDVLLVITQNVYNILQFYSNLLLSNIFHLNTINSLKFHKNTQNSIFHPNDKQTTLNKPVELLGSPRFLQKQPHIRVFHGHQRV